MARDPDREDRDRIDMEGIEEGDEAPLAGEPEDLFEEERERAKDQDEPAEEGRRPDGGPARGMTG